MKTVLEEQLLYLKEWTTIVQLELHDHSTSFKCSLVSHHPVFSSWSEIFVQNFERFQTAIYSFMTSKNPSLELSNLLGIKDVLCRRLFFFSTVAFVANRHFTWRNPFLQATRLSKDVYIGLTSRKWAIDPTNLILMDCYSKLVCHTGAVEFFGIPSCRRCLAGLPNSTVDPIDADDKQFIMIFIVLFKQPFNLYESTRKLER